MLESPLWGLIGGAVGLLASVIVSAIGYFIRQTLADFKEERTKLESRLTDRMAQIAIDLNGVEKEALEIKGIMFQELNKLHDDFVPRREIQEIVKGMREAVTANIEAVREHSRKLDKVLMILAQRHE